MDPIKRAEAIIQDMRVNHLPRIIEGLDVGYVDENQILLLYDHAVRARILREQYEAQAKEGGEDEPEPPPFPPMVETRRGKVIKPNNTKGENND